MKELEKQIVICEGQFNGGEIEPGVFHIQDDKDSDKEDVLGSSGEKAGSEDKERAADSCSEKSSCD